MNIIGGGQSVKSVKEVRYANIIAEDHGVKNVETQEVKKIQVLKRFCEEEVETTAQYKKRKLHNDDLLIEYMINK